MGVEVPQTSLWEQARLHDQGSFGLLGIPIFNPEDPSEMQEFLSYQQLSPFQLPVTTHRVNDSGRIITHAFYTGDAMSTRPFTPPAIQRPDATNQVYVTSSSGYNNIMARGYVRPGVSVNLLSRRPPIVPDFDNTVSVAFCGLRVRDPHPPPQFCVPVVQDARPRHRPPNPPRGTPTRTTPERVNPSPSNTTPERVDPTPTRTTPERVNYWTRESMVGLGRPRRRVGSRSSESESEPAVNKEQDERSGPDHHQRLRVTYVPWGEEKKSGV